MDTSILSWLLLPGLDTSDIVELVARSPQELYEMVCLVGELLPPLPGDGVFAVDALLAPQGRFSFQFCCTIIVLYIRSGYLFIYLSIYLSICTYKYWFLSSHLCPLSCIYRCLSIYLSQGTVLLDPVVWQWQDDRGTWHTYRPNECRCVVHRAVLKLFDLSFFICESFS